ncbi:hypothetical protein TWF694_007759 [Orbilia ellipsospora]|uniref:DJ-1/PfpI domain-containing protein n=1 Tax=Orbilia ellipsospora TaxID=2528407 RepID=A0AAV9XKC8_9PEZI
MRMRSLSIQANWLLLLLGWLIFDFALATGPSKKQLANRSRTVRLGIVLFPGFEPLDVIGPLEIWFSISAYYPLTLSMISFQTGPVTAVAPPHIMVPGQPPVDLSYMIAPKLVATHTFDNAPELDILLIPGGMGNMALAQQNNTSVEDFIISRYPRLEYLQSVCTGSVSLARAGVLKRKKATTNKSSWAWVTGFGEKINWVPTARWTEDGKIWTSSGVSAGMDMTYAFLKMFYGTDDPKTTDTLTQVMNGMEYAPHTDPHWDPYGVVYNVPGADTSQPLQGCVRPVGY